MRVRIVPIFTIIFIWLCTVPAAAQWREEVSVFRVGIADDSAAAARVEPFRLALEQKLELPVEIITSRDYPALIESMLQKRIDYGMLSATAYAALWNLCECVEPLAVAESGNGATAFRTAIFAPRDGPRSIEDLKGNRLAVIESDSVSGDLLALDELEQAGLLAGADKIEIVAFKTGREALDALDAGTVAAYLGWIAELNGGGDTGTLRELAARHGDASGYSIVWRSSEIPYRVHAVRSELPGELKEIVRQALLAMFEDNPVAYDAIEPHFGGGFAPVDHSQFAEISDALARKGIRSPATGGRNAKEEENENEIESQDAN
jgi:phosphonate transport system substrate-binding protein